MPFQPSILGSYHLIIFGRGGGGIDFWREKNSLLPSNWGKKLFATGLVKCSLIQCKRPFKSWLLMKTIFYRFAYGKKIIVSSKARKEFIDPVKKSIS
jgi:hypothetical protein